MVFCIVMNCGDSNTCASHLNSRKQKGLEPSLELCVCVVKSAGCCENCLLKWYCSVSWFRYSRFANVYGPGVSPGSGCFPSTCGPQRQPGLHRPLQHYAHRRAQQIPGHFTAGCVAHEPTRCSGFHPSGRLRHWLGQVGSNTFKIFG